MPINKEGASIMIINLVLFMLHATNSDGSQQPETPSSTTSAGASLSSSQQRPTTAVTHGQDGDDGMGAPAASTAEHDDDGMGGRANTAA